MPPEDGRLEGETDADLADVDLASELSDEPDSFRFSGDEIALVFERSPDLMGVMTKEGRWVRVNPAFELRFGMPRNYLVGQDVTDFIHPRDQAGVRLAMLALRSGNGPLEMACRHCCHDGSYRWVEWKGVASGDDRWFVIGRDVTRRKLTEDALRSSERRFRSIVYSSPMAMYLLRLDGNGKMVIVGANPAAEKVTGIKAELLVGEEIEKAFPVVRDSAIPGAVRQVAEGTSGAMSFVFRVTEPEWRAFDVYVFQTEPGSICATLMDATARLKTEAALKKHQDDLEREVQSRTSLLEARTRQLKALASALTQTEERERSRIAGVIHDNLQQMLVAATLNLEMFKSAYGESNHEEDLERILGILRDSLETTRSLTADLCPTVLHQCGLGSALKWLKCWCEDKYGLSLEVEVNEEPDLDRVVRATLFQGVRELLFNIVKHAEVKTANLRMWGSCGEDVVCVEVSDEGIGFDPAEVRSREGTNGGFGLFSIRERLDLLGGGMAVESHPGGGSRFKLWAPCHLSQENGGNPAVDCMASPEVRDAMAAAGESQVLARSYSGRRIRVVVADDHRVVRETLALMLQSEPDFEVAGLASDGVAALQLVRDLTPDCVVMDLAMPRMDGFKAAAAIHRLFPDVIIIGISSEVDELRREKLLRAGAVDLLHKNRSIQLLSGTVRRYCTPPDA